jgi:hypothetical protein
MSLHQTRTSIPISRKYFIFRPIERKRSQNAHL